MNANNAVLYVKPRYVRFIVHCATKYSTSKKVCMQQVKYRQRENILICKQYKYS
jgi:hypothetical protein